MNELSAKVRLRPTRIGFLVRPTDKKSIREIMRINACLWGGQYNPIIPVFKNTPKDWRDERLKKQLTGKQVAEGYIKFFEPDVYVEAEEGLLEKVGLGLLRDTGFEKKVVSLKEFFAQEYRGINDPYFGQSVLDIINDTYMTERRFQLRDVNPALYSVKKNDLFAELCIGVYPNIDTAKHFATEYYDVFRPEEVQFSPDILLNLFNNEYVTPFSITDKFLDIERMWHDEPIIYIFDPLKITDLIDLWNMRIQPARVFPVPMDWVSKLSDRLRKYIENRFRPLKYNQNGVMHHTTIEISRSISEEYARNNFLLLFNGLPKGSFECKFWYTSIWNVDYKNQFVLQPRRVKITAKEETIDLVIQEDSYLHTKFRSLSPSFSDKFSGSKERWANVLTIWSNYEKTNVAVSLPYNTFDKDWPIQGHRKFNIGREGWVFLQNYEEWNQNISFLENDKAFFMWFKHQGLTVALSDAGRIAKQMVESIGGISKLYLFSNENIIQFINKLANSTRKRTKNGSNDVLEEDFSGKMASIADWHTIISKNQNGWSFRGIEISNYINSNVIKIGLQTECSYCYAKNWHDLDELSYQVKCTRCLKHYDFPQANIKPKNENWKYRVIGPFAVPDYAQGAYTSLLTIRFFTQFRNSHTPSNYSTALEIKHNGKPLEVDFAIWASDESDHDIYPEPRLIIGEAKSFAIDAITEKDLEHLKAVAELLPNCILVISVLKESFSKDEIVRLKKFVEWSRESSSFGPKHWVILLTGTELFNEFLESSWEKKGEPYKNFANFHSIRSLETLSDATISIYLKMDSYYKWYTEKKSKNCDT